MLVEQGWSLGRIAERLQGLSEADVRACIAFAKDAVESDRLRAFLQRGLDDVSAGRLVDDAAVWERFERRFGPLDPGDEP